MKLLTKNTEYSYSGYIIGFDSHSLYSYPGFDWGKKVVIFGVGNGCSMYTDNKKKDILVFGEGSQVFQVHKENFVQVFTTMEATVFYLFMPQKYINSKQKTLK